MILAVYSRDGRFYRLSFNERFIGVLYVTQLAPPLPPPLGSALLRYSRQILFTSNYRTDGGERISANVTRPRAARTRDPIDTGFVHRQESLNV